MNGQGVKIEAHEIIRLIPHLMYMECGNCKNYFFTVDIDGYNDPTYCPYCGMEFEFEIEV